MNSQIENRTLFVTKSVQIKCYVTVLKYRTVKHSRMLMLWQQIMMLHFSCNSVMKKAYQKVEISLHTL